MNPIRKIYHAIISFLHDLQDRVNKTMNVAFPKTEVKYTVLFLWLVLMLVFAYTIAVLDVGIWYGGSGIFHMIRIYLTAPEKQFPWLLWISLCLLVTLVAYGYLVRATMGSTGRGFSLSGSNVYGSAREINQEELHQVADIETKFSAMNTILGQLDLTEERLITAKDNPNSNGNIAIFGPPGSGKSFCFVKPTILQAVRRGHSIICTDTKGELWADTVEFARRHGYVVRRVDLKDPAYSDGWHVLKEMRNDDMRAMIMSQIIMSNTGQGRDIHADAEAALLRAICLYIERNPDIPAEMKTLYNAYSLLLDAGGAEALDTKFKQIQYDEDLKPAWDAYASFIQGSQNLRGNIITGLANRLSVLSSPPVRKMTSTDDIDLTELGKRPTILYLICSDQHETMKFMASLLYSYAFLDLVDFADAQPDRRLPIPVTFLMEEFANLGEVPNITKYLSTCRSRAINIMLVVQSLAQLREIYGENNTDVMLAACATHLCIGYNDKSTAEYFEWRSGEASINVKTEQHMYGETPVQMGKAYSTGEGRRAFFTSHELMTIPQGEIYIVWQRYNCLKAKTFGFNRHPAYLANEITTISTEVRTRLDNRAAKDFIREQEETRIARYNQWITEGGDPWAGYTKPEPMTNGPARGTRLPDIVPYAVLEEMALDHAQLIAADRAARQEQEMAAAANAKFSSEPSKQRRSRKASAQSKADAQSAIALDHIEWESHERKEPPNEHGNENDPPLPPPDYVLEFPDHPIEESVPPSTPVLGDLVHRLTAMKSDSPVLSDTVVLDREEQDQGPVESLKRPENTIGSNGEHTFATEGNSTGSLMSNAQKLIRD